MKKILIAGAAAAAIVLSFGASVATSTTADAQVVVRSGDRGVAVRVGPGPRRGVVTTRRVVRGPACRTVRTRVVRPNGRVVVTTRRVCR